MPVDHSGNILIRVLKSSTSSTVHSHQDLAFDLSVNLSPSIFRAAQFKNLRRNHLVLAVIYQCLNSMIIIKIGRTPALEFMQINKLIALAMPFMTITGHIIHAFMYMIN